MVFLIFMGQLLCLWGMEVGLFRFLMELIAKPLVSYCEKMEELFNDLHGASTVLSATYFVQSPTKMW